MKILSLLRTLTLSFMAVVVSTGHAQANTCSSNTLNANYLVKTKNLHTGKSQTQHIELWRNNDRVAIHYQETGITELWEKTTNNKLHLIRYFENHERGIEYQPNEIKGSHDWSVKYQLVSDQFMQSMEKQKTKGQEQGQGHGCDERIAFTKKQAGTQIELDWYSSKYLINTFNITTEHANTQWKLESVNNDASAVRTKFTTLDGFDTTDYTDVGDNESDPFLAKMINMGFIEHGNSGFYDSEGRSMGSDHHHH